MKCIINADAKVELLLGKQEVDKTNTYRPITYLVFTDEGNTTLVSNTLTGELVEVDEVELSVLKGERSAFDADATNLIEKWYLVPQDNDDYSLCEEIRSFIMMVDKADQRKYNSYLIFTTTDCNARCFYCYQMGRIKSRVPMSDETAIKAADFIIAHATPETTVGIKWYGGEPLYNERAIDLICARLRENNVKFISDMISNAYLFTDENIAKAQSDWNLKCIQIALDGTEEVYNKCKAYIYKDDPSPYRRVLDNMEKLLRAGFKINVRVNMDNHNVDDVYNLADELFERFGKYPQFRLYCAGLYENAGPNNPKRNSESRMQLTENLIAFDLYCEKRGISISRKYKTRFKTNRCMADSNTVLTISPTGMLGLCDHVTETDIVGTLDSGVVNDELAKDWRVRLNNRDTCEACPVFPICIRLKNCLDDGASVCDDAYKKMKYHDRQMTMKRAYRESKQ